MDITTLATKHVKRIHINQHNIRHNAKCDPVDRLPCVTVKTNGKNFRCREAIVDGQTRVVYRPDNPLSCGAKVWIETHDPVKLIDCVNVTVSCETKTADSVGTNADVAKLLDALLSEVSRLTDNQNIYNEDTGEHIAIAEAFKIADKFKQGVE